METKIDLAPCLEQPADCDLRPRRDVGNVGLSVLLQVDLTGLPPQIWNDDAPGRDALTDHLSDREFSRAFSAHPSL